MRILFIRHPESTKNIARSFSSHENQEPLTLLGEQQVRKVVDVLSKYFSDKTLPGLYSATSLRAMALADAIGQSLGVKVVKSPELNSIDSGNVAGLNKEQMDKVAPGYFHKMELYEAGVVDAYTIDHPGESLIEFENRLYRLLLAAEEKDSVAIVIAHKSAITAALIGYARRANAYPEDFFGYIPLETARLSIVDITDSVTSIKEVNVAVEELLGYE
jgi:broad specificity phosphatase PhoE